MAPVLLHKKNHHTLQIDLKEIIITYIKHNNLISDSSTIVLGLSGGPEACCITSNTICA
jgi:hypothetical protein